MSLDEVEALLRAAIERRDQAFRTTSITERQAQAARQRRDACAGDVDEARRLVRDAEAAYLEGQRRGEAPLLPDKSLLSEAEEALRLATRGVELAEAEAKQAVASSLQHITAVYSAALNVMFDRADAEATKMLRAWDAVFRHYDSLSALRALQIPGRAPGGIKLPSDIAAAMDAVAAVCEDRFGPSMQQLQEPLRRQWRSLFFALVQEEAPSEKSPQDLWNMYLKNNFGVGDTDGDPAPPSDAAA